MVLGLDKKHWIVKENKNRNFYWARVPDDAESGSDEESEKEVSLRASDGNLSIEHAVRERYFSQHLLRLSTLATNHLPQLEVEERCCSEHENTE